MKTEMAAARIVIDALLTHLEMLAEEANSPELDKLIDKLDEVNTLAGEIK